jgi:hypothetical protein
MFPTPDLVNGFLRSDRLACVTCFKPLRHSRLGARPRPVARNTNIMLLGLG